MAPSWKLALDRALQKDIKSIAYQLATVDPDTGGPHVRSIVHRGFITAAGKPGLPLLLATTDVRTPKIVQIARSPKIELAWWIPETQEQFRISGTMHVYPVPDFGTGDRVADGGGGETSEERIAFGEVARALSSSFHAEQFGGKDFDWEAKRGEVFNSLSGFMRASWLRPVPGSRLPNSSEHWPETLAKLGEEENQHVKSQVLAAFNNFALLIISPAQVDYVELGVAPHRRTLYRLTENGNWDEERVVP